MQLPSSITFKPALRAALLACSSSAPGCIHTFLTPNAIACSMTWRVMLGGVTIDSDSGITGNSAKVPKAAWPSTFLAVGFNGYTRRPEATSARKTWLPYLERSRDAPATAKVPAFKKACRGFMFRSILSMCTSELHE